jgi:hypothetical protein
VTLPPLLFVAEVVLVLGLAAFAAAVYLGLPASNFRAQLVAAVRPYLRHQGEIAHGLGMSVRSWALIRVAAALAGLGLGALSGIPAVAAGSLALGLIGLPWLLAGRAAQRRLHMERALTGLLVEIRNLMQQSNLALDRALREAGRNPGPELAHVLAPLAGDEPIGECLAEVGRRAGSPLADLVVTALMIARTHSPVALVRVIEEVLIPVLGVTVEVQEENHATVAQQRAAAVAIGVIMLVLFAAVVRVPSMHAFYDSLAGQLVLALVATMYVGLVWLIGRIARPVPWVEWDVDAVRKETEALLV